MKNVGIVILAAGASTRMGRAKQLLPLNGQPLLLHAVDEALSTTVQHVSVVLGSDHDRYSDLLETYPVQIVVNEYWSNGIGSSIKAGLSAITRQVKNLDAVLYMVGDQPAVRFEYLCQIINTYYATEEPLIASGYADTFGVPALFDRSFFDEIMQIDDSDGAKKVLMRHSNQLMILDCPNGALDLDTPDDYHNFQRQFQR